MILEILFTLSIAFCITLFFVHYYLYHKENEFVLKKFDLNTPIKHQEVEKSMKEREILYIQNFNTISIDIDWVKNNIKNKNNLIVHTIGEENKRYAMPLKEWYDIYKKRKHKPLYVFPDTKSIEYFNYEDEFKGNFRQMVNSRFYDLNNSALRYYSRRIINVYENVNSFYRIVIPLSKDADIRLVSPRKRSSLYLRTAKAGEHLIKISKYRSDKNINYKEYPKAHNLKYVTIALKKNNMIMIPFNWSYSITNYKGLILEANIENLFSSSWKYLEQYLTHLSSTR